MYFLPGICIQDPAIRGLCFLYLFKDIALLLYLYLVLLPFIFVSQTFHTVYSPFRFRTLSVTCMYVCLSVCRSVCPYIFCKAFFAFRTRTFYIRTPTLCTSEPRPYVHKNHQYPDPLNLNSWWNTRCTNTIYCHECVCLCHCFLLKETGKIERNLNVENWLV